MAIAAIQMSFSGNFAQDGMFLGVVSSIYWLTAGARNAVFSPINPEASSFGLARN
jgi:hypothetical protein